MMNFKNWDWEKIGLSARKLIQQGQPVADRGFEIGKKGTYLGFGMGKDFMEVLSKTFQQTPMVKVFDSVHNVLSRSEQITLSLIDFSQSVTSATLEFADLTLDFLHRESFGQSNEFFRPQFALYKTPISTVTIVDVTNENLQLQQQLTDVEEVDEEYTKFF